MRTRTTAVRLHPAYDDPAAVRALIEGAGPFWPLARYAASEAERDAVGGDAVGGRAGGGRAVGGRAGGGESGHHTFVPPWFRQDVAVLGSSLVPGAELILHNPRFVAAAHAVYGDDAVVRPTTVYVNVMGATPFPFVPHLDIPAFRGMTREHHPLWLLKQMQASGLFEDWRVRLATAVSWFWDGPGGAFHYWPDGPEGRHEVEEPPFDNVAIVADNEATFHGVGPVGSDDDRMPMGLTLAAELRRDGDGWAVVDGGEVRRRYGLDAMRITVSWKADVFADERAAAVADGHEDDLTLDRVVDTFVADLRARGIAVTAPNDPHHDEVWVAALADAYRSGIPRIVHA